MTWPSEPPPPRPATASGPELSEGLGEIIERGLARRWSASKYGFPPKRRRKPVQRFNVSTIHDSPHP